MLKRLDESGYRNVNVGISGNSVKMARFQNVPMCMQRLSRDIQDLVQNADSMEQDEYLKRAVQLQYRFIRIHPFTDSNGRTSRALLNMMTIPKGILIEVPKEKKAGFVQAQRDTNKQLDSQGYFEALNGNLDELDQIEAENIDLPTYEFIRQNCVVEVQQLQEDSKTMEIQRENGITPEEPEEQQQ